MKKINILSNNNHFSSSIIWLVISKNFTFSRKEDHVRYVYVKITVTRVTNE